MDLHSESVLPDLGSNVLPDVGNEQEVAIGPDIHAVLDGNGPDLQRELEEEVITSETVAEGNTNSFEDTSTNEVKAPSEDDLISHEKLDRSSPELWPQDLTSAARHIRAKEKSKSNEAEKPESPWTQGLDPEDINLLHQFGSLTSSSLIEEVKKLQNIAHQLGLEEAKEITRGKLLHVLDLPTNSGR